MTPLEPSDLANFPTRQPCYDELQYKICMICNRAITKSVEAAHMLACKEAMVQRARERKARQEAAALATAAPPTSVAATATTTEEAGEGCAGVRQADPPPTLEVGASGRKRKATGSVYKDKPQKASKLRRKRGEAVPIDVERHCGVPLPNGLLCARSLTCKCHTMGAKRAVRGRSGPYDLLLAAHRRRGMRTLYPSLCSFSANPQIQKCKPSWLLHRSAKKPSKRRLSAMTGAWKLISSWTPLSGINHSLLCATRRHYLCTGGTSTIACERPWPVHCASVLLLLVLPTMEAKARVAAMASFPVCLHRHLSRRPLTLFLQA